MPRLSLPLLCFGIILVQLDEGRFITKARPKKYDCSEIEIYSRENALQTSGKSVEGEVANWWKGQMPLCSRTQWIFESLADQNSEFLCWRFQLILCPTYPFQWKILAKRHPEVLFTSYMAFVLPTLYTRGSGNLTRQCPNRGDANFKGASLRWMLCFLKWTFD